jgi:hypothetical protein
MTSPPTIWIRWVVTANAAWLVLLVLNMFAVPEADRLGETFVVLGDFSQLVVFGVCVGYVVLALLGIGHSARLPRRVPASSMTRSGIAGRGLLLAGGIGIVSLVPWSLLTLMRDDHAANGPLVNALWVIAVSSAALLIGTILAAISKGTNASHGIERPINS